MSKEWGNTVKVLTTPAASYRRGAMNDLVEGSAQFVLFLFVARVASQSHSGFSTACAIGLLITSITNALALVPRLRGHRAWRFLNKAASALALLIFDAFLMRRWIESHDVFAGIFASFMLLVAVIGLIGFVLWLRDGRKTLFSR